MGLNQNKQKEKSRLWWKGGIRDGGSSTWNHGAFVSDMLTAQRQTRRGGLGGGLWSEILLFTVLPHPEAPSCPTSYSGDFHWDLIGTPNTPHKSQITWKTAPLLQPLTVFPYSSLAPSLSFPSLLTFGNECQTGTGLVCSVLTCPWPRGAFCHVPMGVSQWDG